MNIVFLILIFSSMVFADDRTHQAEMSLEMRQFSDDSNEETFENQRSVYIDYKTKKKNENSFNVFSFAGRYDDQDPERSLIWPENIYIQYFASSNMTLSAGTQIFNYSYLEAFNPLDVFNARIIDVSIVSAQKIGEPFIGFDWYVGDGDLKFYILPYALNPVLPGRDSRLNLGQNFNTPVWIGQEGKESALADNFVLSYEKSFESSDLVMLVSKSYDRLRLLIGTDNYSTFGNTIIPNTEDLYTPFYFERYLSGFNYVYNFSSFQWKISSSYSYYLAEDEIYTVNGLRTPSDYTTMASGVEKSVEHRNGHGSTFLVEVQKIFVDSKDESDFTTQNDLFFTWRYNLNDIDSKLINLSLLYDLSSPEAEGFIQLGYEQRLTNSWKIELGGIHYYIPEDASLAGIGLFEDKEHIYTKISKFY